MRFLFALFGAVFGAHALGEALKPREVARARRGQWLWLYPDRRLRVVRRCFLPLRGVGGDEWVRRHPAGYDCWPGGLAWWRVTGDDRRPGALGRRALTLRDVGRDAWLLRRLHGCLDAGDRSGHCRRCRTLDLERTHQVGADLVGEYSRITSNRFARRPSLEEGALAGRGKVGGGGQPRNHQRLLMG